MSRQTDDDLLELAKKRFKQMEDATRAQRQRVRDDLAFYAGRMWSDDDLKARAAQTATDTGLPPVPARPSFTVNLVKEPVRQVLNQERQSELGVQLVPADDFAALIGPQDDTEIELREGLVRRIQRESEASDARTWAFTRAVIGGDGYYGVMTRYLPGKTFDQEIYIQRFYNQASVGLDPAHEQPDGSDAEWAFVGNDLPWDDYKARHPRTATEDRNRVCSATKDEFRAFGDEAPGWFTSEGDVRMVRVCDYWYTERTTRTLVQLMVPSDDGTLRDEVFWQDELPEGFPVPKDAPTRKVIGKQIRWCQIDGVQVLDRTDWPGPDIPIIKVLGEELQPYDQERRAEGMVRPARDSNVGFNAMLSKGVELIGLAPIPPFQVAEGQVEGYEAWYQAANTRTLPYLPYRAKDLEGNVAGAPQRTNVDTPIAAVATFMQVFRDTTQSTTGIHDPQLGKVDPSVKSGRAIRFLQEQSQHGTSNFLDNLKRSIRYEGQIINNLLFPIYGKPGRIARILNSENEAETVFVNGPPAQMPQLPPGKKPPTDYKLTKEANCNVIVKITRAYDSRRTEEATMISELLSANPIFMSWFGDLFFEHSDGPGHQQLAERAKIMLDPKIQQMLAQKQQGNGRVSPEVQMQMAQLMARLQEAEKVMQSMNQELQTRQADANVKLQIADMQRATQIKLREMQDATAISVAHIAAAAKGVALDAHAEEEAIALGHEAEQLERDREHEREMTAMGQAHHVAAGAMQQDAATVEAERQRAHEITLQPRAADEPESE